MLARQCRKKKDSDKNESIIATSDSEASASESEQNEPPSSLAFNTEEYERMQATYTAVGRDFKDKVC